MSNLSPECALNVEILSKTDGFYPESAVQEAENSSSSGRAKLLVSVIIPCFNQGRHLRDALQSVRTQTYPWVQVCLVDDGSNCEETISVVDYIANRKEPGLTVLRCSNGGPSVARNTGIAHSADGWILPLDGDDMLCRDYIERAVNAILSSSSIGLVYGNHIQFTGKQERLVRVPDLPLERILTGNFVTVCSLFKRSDWLCVGGYKSKMNSGWEDWEFWLSLLEHGVESRHLGQYPCFRYRRSIQSRNSSISIDQRMALLSTMIDEHKDLYSRNVEIIVLELFRLQHYHEMILANSRMIKISSWLKSLSLTRSFIHLLSCLKTIGS